MRARSLLVIGWSVAQLAGVVQLVRGHTVHAALALLVLGAGLHGARAVFVTRARWRRLRSWPRPGEAEPFPSGPRRVPLLETGLVISGLGPE